MSELQKGLYHRAGGFSILRKNEGATADLVSALSFCPQVGIRQRAYLVQEKLWEMW